MVNYEERLILIDGNIALMATESLCGGTAFFARLKKRLQGALFGRCKNAVLQKACSVQQEIASHKKTDSCKAVGFGI